MMYVLLLINAIVLMCLFSLGYSNRFGVYSGSALNPVIFISILNIFFTIDFYALYNNPVISLYEKSFYFDSSDVVYGYFYYVCSLISICYGCSLALSTSHSLGGNFLFFLSNIKESESLFVFRVFSVIMLIAVILLSMSLGDMISGEVSRQKLFADNKFIVISFAAFPTILSFYISNKDPFSLFCILSIIISILIVLITGSRGGILFIIIIFSCLIDNKYKTILPCVYLIAIPFSAVLLLMSRYYFREAWRYDTLSDFLDAKNGIYGVFFETAEISMAEVIVTIVKLGDNIHRLPFESFLAGILYPLPRSIFIFKPYGAGGVFTNEFSPMRWDNSRSEIVTTGFGDLYLQFGFLLSLMVLSILSYFWVKLVVKSIQVLGKKSVLFVPFLMWWAYIFIRSGIFNMSGSIWASLLIYSFIWVSKKPIFSNQ